MTFYKNKKLFNLAIIISLVFGVFLGFNNGNVFAIEDSTISFSEGHSFVWNQSIFPDCSTNSCLSQYNYLIVSSYPKNSQFIGLRFKVGNSNQDVRCYTTSCAFELPSSLDSIQWLGNSVSAPYDFSLTLTDTFGSVPPTATLNVSENGTFNVSNYASVVVDVPQTINEVVEDPISNDFQKVFFKIVENIIPAFGILLVVWFGIDMLSSLIFGRGR